MNMKMGIEAALRICFLLFLLSASWQDLKKKSIKMRRDSSEKEKDY